MADIVRDIIDRTDRMRADRSSFESHWQEIRDFVFPMAAAVTRIETAGTKSHQQVLDNTGEQAHEMLAAALVGTLTPAHIDWFSLRATDDRLNRIESVAIWLEDCAQKMLAVLRAPRSNFASQQHEKYMDVVAFGTAGMYITDRPGRGILFSTRPLRELLLDEDDDGRVDTVHRDYTLTARQAVQRYGGKVGPKIAKAAADPKKQHEKFRFVQAVYPRSDRDPQKSDKRNMPFANVEVSVDDKTLLAEGGFHEMPFVTPRWGKRSEEIYGRGPGMKALADVKSLQRAMKITFKGAEKVMDPPLMVADDGILSPVRVNPSGLNFYRSGSWSIDPIKPLITGARPDLAEEFMQGIRLRIDASFLKHLVQMIRKDRMTATEVLRVTEEGQTILGPYLGRLQSEDLGPIVERLFAIMLRANAFLPMPKELQGQEVHVSYEQPAAKAQRMSRARALAQLGEITAPLVQLKPELMDNLDLDTAYRDTADILGMPKTWLRPADQVAALREQRQQAQQQAQEQQAALQTVDTAANAVRALPALRQAMEPAQGQEAPANV